MSLHQAHILRNNGVAELIIPFTNKLSEFIILLLKLNTNLLKSSPQKRMFLIYKHFGGTVKFCQIK